MWEKTGATKGYQKLITVDAESSKLPGYKTTTDHTYYRQRITVHKQDEDGKGLGGIQFTLSADNLDDLYSFNVFDRNGDTTSNADEDDNTEFEVSGFTTDGGTVAWRMTYRLEADEIAYYTDDTLAAMNADQKKAAKEALEEDGYKQGVHFGKNMTKAEADDLIKQDLKAQMKDISNAYTLTENSVGNNKNIFLDPSLAKGVKITLKEANSWQKNASGDWPDKLVEHPTQYEKAYITNLTNKYKKAAISIAKKSGGSADGSAHGDATLDGAVFQLYADKECTQKATVYDAAGNAKVAGVYQTSGGRLTTDYLRSGNTYYLKEIQAPTGFLLSDEVKELKIDASAKTDEFTPVLFEADFSDSPIKGKIAVKKKSYDPTRKKYYPENNTTFQVYLKSKGSYEKCADDERTTIKTNADGYAATGDLVYGTYVVHQVDSGDVDAYYVDDFEAQITENGKVYEFEKVNELFKAYFKIIKKDKNTEKTVLKPGTSYQIYQVVDGKEELVTQEYMEDGETKTADTFICDESGEVVTVDSLCSGTYHIYEVAAADGMHINHQYVEIVVNSKADNYESYIDEDGYHHVTIMLEYLNEETKGRLNLLKTGEVLKGWDNEKQEFIFEEVKLDGVEFTLYADGDILTQDGQSTDNARDTWFKDGDKVAVLTTGKGVEFTSECGGITGYTMDEDGTIHVSLPLGKYKLEENKTPSDIDIVAEYQGTAREDDLFNLFHEDDFCIGGCKVDINPIKEEKSGSLTAFLQQAVYFMESELAFSIADRYIYIQDATEGYDYTIYDSDFTELDGGVYDDPEISIYEALDEIVGDLKKQPDTDRIKGEITEELQLIPVNLEEFEEALERSHYVPPEVTYTVAECGEFHSMGRYRDDIKDVQEAIALWKEFQDSSLNGIPSIGILVHTPGQTDLEDEQLDLLSGQKIDLDMMQYYPVICKEEAAIEKICELIENLPEVGMIGKVPERISTELLLRELDPGKSLFSEVEKSLIREYGLQMKDERKTRELAEKLCSRDKIGNQDAALVIQEARDKIEEKRLTPNTTPYIL